ncbi:pro-resilin-like [Athalia rosae]|uniref:pro-resilin-like n=1 Tax=Athalia rosae TaxID=37344 RepID=UPI000A0EE42C|nr:pro-resilin-like [Athalia rosae]
MMNIQVTLLSLAATAMVAVADIAPGSNRYLPPDPTKGYEYNRPTVTFPPRPTPSFPVPTRPPPNFPINTVRPVFPVTPRPTPIPRPTPGFPDYTGQPSGNNGNTLVPNHEHHDHGDHHHHVPGMPYDFNYAVKDDAYGTDYSHNAISDGDVVRGEYRVQLPDGRLQIVRYTADWKTGFNADVTYEGTPRYDAPRPTPGFTGY